jgi:leader peptidase (prepilin peptidase)/N-methyltransferase
MIQLAWFIFVVFGIALSAIDLEHFRLPNVLTLPLALAIFILLLIDSTQLHQYRDLRYAIYSSLALTFFYFLVHLISRGGLGFGDVKFAIAIGFLTGYGSTIGTYVASMLAFILGSIVGLFLITIKGGGRKTKVPLGPFMFAGAIASIWVIPHIEALLL